VSVFERVHLAAGCAKPGEPGSLSIAAAITAGWVALAR
jgi:hypothetical protein